MVGSRYNTRATVLKGCGIRKVEPLHLKFTNSSVLSGGNESETLVCLILSVYKATGESFLPFHSVNREE